MYNLYTMQNYSQLYPYILHFVGQRSRINEFKELSIRYSIYYNHRVLVFLFNSEYFVALIDNKYSSRQLETAKHSTPN